MSSLFSFFKKKTRSKAAKKAKTKAKPLKSDALRKHETMRAFGHIPSPTQQPTGGIKRKTRRKKRKGKKNQTKKRRKNSRKKRRKNSRKNSRKK